MRKLLLIGIGAGNPEHVTMQAVRALNQVDVFIVADKGDAKEELVRLRSEICERYIERRDYRFVTVADPVRDATIADYGERVRAWHEERVARYEQLLLEELAEGGVAAFLVWGDPSLYDSTLRIVEQLAARARVPFEYEVIPGISSVQALAASHKLALNRIGGSVLITTGRKLAAQGLPADVSDAVIMLDGECSFRELDDDLEIYWGAYVGSKDEILRAGKLRDVRAEIEQLRAEAKQRHGWVMDIYLLRRP